MIWKHLLRIKLLFPKKTVPFFLILSQGLPVCTILLRVPLSNTLHYKYQKGNNGIHCTSSKSMTAIVKGNGHVSVKVSGQRKMLKGWNLDGLIQKRQKEEERKESWEEDDDDIRSYSFFRYNENWVNWCQLNPVDVLFSVIDLDNEMINHNFFSFHSFAIFLHFFLSWKSVTGNEIRRCVRRKCCDSQFVNGDKWCDVITIEWN